jgi:nuclear protein localization protein 4 homolog
MAWTLNDFIALDSQYEFKIQRQEHAICQQVSIDVKSISNFQSYVQQFRFTRKRYGFLYGTYVNTTTSTTNTKNNATTTTATTTTSPMDIEGDDKPQKHHRRVIVEAIYEPPQEMDTTSAEGWIPMNDPHENQVQQMATMLGLQKVGWIFCHEARDKGYVLSSAEVIMAAEYQLEAADGVNETPFVTIVVSPEQSSTNNDNNSNNNNNNMVVKVEAYQVSQQCMAMVAEQALEVNAIDPKQCMVNETFTAIQEGKPSKTIENNFFLTVVPIVQHTSETFIADFPYLNRDVDTRTPSHDEMKKQLSQSGKAGWTFVDRLADFNLLIYLSDYLDIKTDFPNICRTIVDRTNDLDDGYKLIIKSLAGMDGSY